MSMVKSIYLGYYFKCEKKENVDPFSVFTDESFYRVFDEGGNKEINESHIYIPNKKCDDCYHLDEYSNTGIIGFQEDKGLPELIENGGKVLDALYEDAELRYGVLVYVC